MKDRFKSTKPGDILSVLTDRGDWMEMRVVRTNGDDKAWGFFLDEVGVDEESLVWDVDAVPAGIEPGHWVRYRRWETPQHVERVERVGDGGSVYSGIHRFRLGDCVRVVPPTALSPAERTKGPFPTKGLRLQNPMDLSMTALEVAEDMLQEAGDEVVLILVRSTYDVVFWRDKLARVGLPVVRWPELVDFEWVVQGWTHHVYSEGA